MNIMIPEGYKASAIGLIPIDWDLMHFEQVADIDNLTLKSSTEKGYRFNYISLSDVDSDEFKIETKLQIFETAPSRARRIVSKGDVLMSTVRPNLQGFSIIKGEVNDLIASTGFAVITCTNCHNEYLFHYLFSSGFSKQLYQLIVGSNYPAINSSDVKRLKLPVPSSKEQKAIAIALSLMDDNINKTNQLISKKEVQKKALMQQLLTGKKRLKGFDGEWKESKLGNIFERVTRRNAENNANVVTISAQRGFVLQRDFFNKTIASEILDAYFLVERGEFCYNKSYSNGYPWGATKRLNNLDKAVVTTLYICFKLSNPKENSGDFFEHYFEYGSLEKGLMKIAHEGGRAHGLLNVTAPDFFNLKITIPDYNQQTAISRVLQTADKEIKLLKAKADKLKEQKKGMMQVLLTGKKRLKVRDN
jgi:type I restriction enzyme S subunit